MIPIMQTILNSKYNHLGAKDILDLLVGFTIWYEEKFPNISFTKDAVTNEFGVYLKEINL